MTALHGAFALAEVDDVTVCVAEDLNFDVPRPFEVSFEINARVTERMQRLG